MNDLKVGDRIRIIGVPTPKGEHYYLHKDTVAVWRQLAKRGRSVRIHKIDEYGSPWYECRFRRKNGRFDYHQLSVHEDEDNWVKVKKR